MKRLIDAGARMVLCRKDKSPLRRNWLKSRPFERDIFSHIKKGGLVGIIPSSINMSVVDIDGGDITPLTQEFPPTINLPSRRMVHLYYRDKRPRPNAKFDHGIYRGDIRSGSGYVILWGDNAERLSGVERKAGSDFPAHLFFKDKTREKKVNPSPGVFGDSLEEIYPGKRNISLFDSVRLWSYSIRVPDDFGKWRNLVADYAESANRRFPVPLEVSEVESVSFSVAMWRWRGGGPFDHSWASQYRRGKVSGEARRARTAARDGRILEMRNEGHTLRHIGDTVGISPRSVSYILAREGHG